MKKLDFICPICGGRLLVCWFETGSTDYIVSKKGKQYKNPIRRASTNLSPIEDARLICCENVYNRTCDFATNCVLEFDNSPEYDRKFMITQTNDGYELYGEETTEETELPTEDEINNPNLDNEEDIREYVSDYLEQTYKCWACWFEVEFDTRKIYISKIDWDIR